MLKRNFGIPKRNLVDQKNQSLTKNSLRLNKSFFGRPKKGRNRLNNWSTKRLTKTTWTGLLSTAICMYCNLYNFEMGKTLYILFWVNSLSQSCMFRKKNKFSLLQQLNYFQFSLHSFPHSLEDGHESIFLTRLGQRRMIDQ